MGHTDTAAANNEPARAPFISVVDPTRLGCVTPGKAVSPLKASHRSIDLTRSHTLRRPSVRHRPYMQLNGLFVRVPLHLGTGGALSQRRAEKYIILCMRWRGRDRCLDGRLCPRGRASWRAPHGHRLPSPPCAVFGAAKSRSREAPCWCPSSVPSSRRLHEIGGQTLRSPNGKGGDGTTM